MSNYDPAQVRAYTITIDGVELAHFSEVSGLKEEYEIVKYDFLDAAGRKAVSLQPGNYKPGELTLKRGTGDLKLADWFDNVRKGDGALARKQINVKMLDGLLQKELASFTLRNCFPKSIEYSGVKASGNEASIETCVIVYEELRRDA